MKIKRIGFLDLYFGISSIYGIDVLSIGINKEDYSLFSILYYTEFAKVLWIGILFFNFRIPLK